MAKQVKTYDPKKVLTNFCGIPVTGYVEDTFIAISSEGEGIKAIIGCDQEVVRTIDPGSVLKTIKISLLQSSDTNDLLSNIHDRDNQQGDGIGSLLITDLTGKTYLAADQAWITKKPEINRGRSAKDGACHWEFQAVVNEEDYHIGGHS